MSWVRLATTWQSVTFSTVTGTWAPSSAKMRVMPSFWAMRPVRMSVVPFLELDLDVHAGGEVELHQRVHRLGRGVNDVEKTLVRTDFELLARLLVNVRAAVHRKLLDAGGQRDRPANLGASPLGGIDDLARGLVQHAMIKRLQADADVLAFHD
ncbi:hypothetical protein MTBLM1_40320 [Rhodospirillaceae bacterium LM-1]|nr:hypothetical protein MTBLM1_40320 [Rhodospirillaceae bacterium LM-1]